MHFSTRSPNITSPKVPFDYPSAGHMIRRLPRQPVCDRERENGGIDSIHPGEVELSVATKYSIEYRYTVDSTFSPR